MKEYDKYLENKFYSLQRLSRGINKLKDLHKLTLNEYHTLAATQKIIEYKMQELDMTNITISVKKKQYIIR